MPRFSLVLIGAAAGFVSGLTGAVGLLFNRFYLRYGLQKEEIVATRAANEVLLHLIKLVLYASFGLLTTKAISLGAVVAVAALFSSWSIKWILPRLSEGIFRRFGYAAMVLSGLALFVEAASQFRQKTPVALTYALFPQGLETQLQWRKKLFTMEFEYDEGFEFEYSVPLSELPLDQQAQVKRLSRGADSVFLEEVFGLDHHAYEAYIYRQGKVEKVDL